MCVIACLRVGSFVSLLARSCCCLLACLLDCLVVWLFGRLDDWCVCCVRLVLPCLVVSCNVVCCLFVSFCFVLFVCVIVVFVLW